MQKIILFIESVDNAYLTPAKIGDMFMNRFVIDEDASCEILRIFELSKTPSYAPLDPGPWTLVVEKGMDHFKV